MKTLKEIAEDIKKIKNEKDIESEIIKAFGGYEFQGVTEVTIYSPDKRYFDPNIEGRHAAFISPKFAVYSDHIYFEVEKGDQEGAFSIKDAWEY